ncbi:MAG: hypothetical protein U0359_31400 [Byssovorax sp.]
MRRGREPHRSAAAACPADAKVAAGTVCRASAGVCDVVESCDGASNNCPADGFLPASSVCRAAVAGAATWRRTARAQALLAWPT